MSSFEHADIIIDQLGEVRPEFYVNSMRSRERDPNQEDVFQKPGATHAHVSSGEDGGVPALIISPNEPDRLGETALYTAYVEHTNPENIVFWGYQVRLSVTDLPDIPTPYMSKSEIARRFEAIKGVTFTEQDQEDIVRKALLIVAHFKKLRPSYPEESPDATASADDTPPSG